MSEHIGEQTNGRERDFTPEKIGELANNINNLGNNIQHDGCPPELYDGICREFHEAVSSMYRVEHKMKDIADIQRNYRVMGQI